MGELKEERWRHLLKRKLSEVQISSIHASLWIRAINYKLAKDLSAGLSSHHLKTLLSIFIWVTSCYIKQMLNSSNRRVTQLKTVGFLYPLVKGILRILLHKLRKYGCAHNGQDPAGVYLCDSSNTNVAWPTGRLHGMQLYQRNNINRSF